MGYPVYTTRFNSSLQQNETNHGWNIFTTVKAPRSDGTESILVSSTYSKIPANTSKSYIDGLGFVVAIASQISKMKWISRDYHFLFTPECHGDAGTAHWIEDYHSPSSVKESLDMILFPRSTILAALYLEVAPESALTSTFDILSIKLHGSNGQLPNLDLINTITRVASGGAGITNIDFGALVPIPGGCSSIKILHSAYS